MVYVALLRGINVGGNNKIDMKQLKETFSAAGMKSVKSSINSGNVIFKDEDHTKAKLQELLEKAIAKEFKLEIKVLIRSLDEYDAMMKLVPDDWNDGPERKCDVLFLWEEIDDKKLLDEVDVKDGIDTVIYAPGALLWAAERSSLTRSGLMKIAKMPIYKKMTVRNVNSARKIHHIMKDVQITE